MSLAYLESQITDVRNRADNVRTNYENAVRQVKDNTSLSDLGKREALQHHYETAKESLSKLRQQEVDLVEDRKQKLSKELFGLTGTTSSDPNQIIAYRDAQDRAARIESGDDARRLLGTAKLSDDKSLVSAILARAVSEGWTSIITEHLKDKPAAEEKLRDLQKLQEYNTFASAGFTYMVSNLFSGV